MPIILYLFLSAVSMRFFIFRKKLIKKLSRQKATEKGCVISDQGYKCARPYTG